MKEAKKEEGKQEGESLKYKREGNEEVRKRVIKVRKEGSIEGKNQEKKQEGSKRQ